MPPTESAALCPALWPCGLVTHPRASKTHCFNMLRGAVKTHRTRLLRSATRRICPLLRPTVGCDAPWTWADREWETGSLDPNGLLDLKTQSQSNWSQIELMTPTVAIQDPTTSGACTGFVVRSAVRPLSSKSPHRSESAKVAHH